MFIFIEEEYFQYFKENTSELPLLYYRIKRDLEDIWEFTDGILHDEYDEKEQIEVLGHVRRILIHLSRDMSSCK